MNFSSLNSETISPPLFKEARKKQSFLNFLLPKMPVVIHDDKKIDNEDYNYKKQATSLLKKIIGLSELANELIEELKKPVLKEGAVREKRRNADNGNKRIIGKIIILLKHIPGFSKFMNFFNAASFITHRHYQKGSYVFKQGERSDFFYGIISGKISIREKKKIKKIDKDEEGGTGMFQFMSYSVDKKREVSEFIETEKLQLNEGQCFGEWGLIYRKERSASAYCIEDCDLYLLDVNYFDLCFSKCMAKAENDRKLFLTNSIPYLKTIPKHRFETLYKGFIAVFHDKGEYIYRQDSKAEEILVIYQGCCSIEKYLPIITKEEKFVTVMYLQKGDLAGLESLNYVSYVDFAVSTNVEEINKEFEIRKDNESIKNEKNIFNSPDYQKLNAKNFPVYKSSLKSIENDTIVIHIKISALNEYREVIRESLKSIKSEKDTIIDNLIKKKIDSMNKHKVIYREKQIRRQMKNTDGSEYDQRMNIEKLNNFIEKRSTSIKLIQEGSYNKKNCRYSINKEFINTLRTNKVEPYSEKARRSTRRFILENDMEKKIFDDSFYQHLTKYKPGNKSQTIDKENDEEYKFKSTENENEDHIHKNLLFPKISSSILKSSTLGRNVRNIPIQKLNFIKNESKNDIKIQTSEIRRHNSILGVCITEPSSTCRNPLEEVSLFETYFAKEKLRDPSNSRAQYTLISDVDSQTDRNNSRSIRENILQSISTLPNDDIINKSNKCNDKMTSTFKALALTPLKNTKIIFEQDKETKLLSKKVINNLKNWDKSLYTKKYMSGRFDMPLLSLTEKNIK